MANALSILLTIATLQFSLTTANVSIVSVCDGAHICDCVCVCLWLAKYSYLWCLHQADRSKWHPGNVNIENPSQICDDNTRQLAQHVLLIHRKWYVDVGSVNAHNDMKTNVQRANAYLDWKLKAKRRFFFSLKNEKTEIEKNETEREREREKMGKKSVAGSVEKMKFVAVIQKKIWNG